MGKRLKTFLELVQEEEIGGGVVPEGEGFGKLARLAGSQGEGGANLAIRWHELWVFFNYFEYFGNFVLFRIAL